MLKVLFDTSTLVAAMMANHPSHAVCFSWLQQVQLNQKQGFVCTHSIAELYSILTRLPVNLRLSPNLVQNLINSNLSYFTKVSLRIEDYENTVARMVSLNLAGGVIYDALIGQAAITSQVDLLLTLNPKDFQRLGLEIAQLVQIPS